MSMIRLRRLQADFDRLREYVWRQPRVRLIQTEGNPPEKYQLEYQIRSLRQIDEQLHLVASHIVEVYLPANYPRMPPQCRMLTPIFHPNIAPHAICIGDHWSAGEPLWSMVARIGEMIAYQSYNTKSPLNGEAARWVDGNLDKLPLDPINMNVDDPQRSAAPQPFAAAGPAAPARPMPAGPMPMQPQSSQPAAAATFEIACPTCQARYRVPAGSAGKRVRCKKCQQLMEVPPMR